MNDPNQYPPGWDLGKVKNLIAHYEGQSEDEAEAEDEARLHQPDQTVMVVPTKLVPLIRELVAQDANAPR